MKDKSKLVKKQITDKNGKHTYVWVKSGETDQNNWQEFRPRILASGDYKIYHDASVGLESTKMPDPDNPKKTFRAKSEGMRFDLLEGGEKEGSRVCYEVVNSWYDHINDRRIKVNAINLSRMDTMKQRQGIGSNMLLTLMRAEKDRADHIGTFSANDKSYGMLQKFERYGYLKPVMKGRHEKTVLWKIQIEKASVKAEPQGEKTMRELREKKSRLSDEFKKMAAEHESKYGHMPIDSPMSKEERESKNRVDKKASEMNSVVMEIRRLMKESK